MIMALLLAVFFLFLSYFSAHLSALTIKKNIKSIPNSNITVIKVAKPNAALVSSGHLVHWVGKLLDVQSPKCLSQQPKANSQHIATNSQQVGAHTPQVNAHSPQVNAHSPQATAHSPQVDTHRPTSHHQQPTGRCLQSTSRHQHATKTYQHGATYPHTKKLDFSSCVE